MRFMLFPLFFLLAGSLGCDDRLESANGKAADAIDFCALSTDGAKLEVSRPAPEEEPIDDVNWFARPVWNDRGEWIIAFASHKQNYLYNLTTGDRIRIPDESDAVATPDGRYVTVPSNYTPDDYIRFYDAKQLLAHLDRREDAHQLPPVYVHRHPDLRKVYYQSTALVSREVSASSTRTVYRLMFSGTRDEAQFRIVDYTFETDAAGALTVEPGEPMKLCPEITNDLNTPFISKDARYVVSYTSSSAEAKYSPGSSLKIYRITEVLPEQSTTRCEQVVDFGFAAGKADFSFDNAMVTFHISKGGYLTPFINGGLEPTTVTDVVIAELTHDDEGDINGYSRLARVTTSLREGVGSYFPAFLQDGRLFYVASTEPKTSEGDKRFTFKVVDPAAELKMANVFAEPERLELAGALGKMWESACATDVTPSAAHEAPWILTSLNGAQCRALIDSEWSEAYPAKESLMGLCALTS